MKKHLFLVTFAISQLLLAQEPGKIGTLLRNEAKSSDKIALQPFEWNGNRRERHPQQPRQYYWNRRAGYAELFLRIPENGYFTVQIGNQQISNDNGLFRFFDLSAGQMPISIYENGYLVYRAMVFTKHNYRTVLDFFTNYGLYELASYPIDNQWYGTDNWNDIWNNPYRQNSFSRTGIMTDDAFQYFLNQMNASCTFDHDKKNFIEQQLRTTSFTARQIQALLFPLDFDDNKLEMAKRLYATCVDKQNFYIVYNVFTFEINKHKLIDFVNRY